MLRRRQKNNTKISTACGGIIEKLESRQLLTTITDSGASTIPSTIEYKDASDALVRVAFHGVTAELVFGNVTEAQPQIARAADLVLPGDEQTPGRDLFHIYVQKATIDSYISIARVPGLTANPRPMDPFGGGVALTTRNLVTGDYGSVTSGPGGVLLGSRTLQLGDVANTADRPILQMQFSGLGILPANKSGKLAPGLNVAPGQDLGKFLFGGTVTGSVYVPTGSMKLFYAGALLTGDARGQRSLLTGGSFPQPVGVPQLPNNFFVGGDLRDLVVLGNIGTNGRQANPDEPIYVTGTDIQIHGRSNQIRAFGSEIARVVVHNDPKAPRITAGQQELERRGDYLPDENFPAGGDETDFEFGLLGKEEFNNDTFDTPQFLGVFNSKKLGNDVISVNGLLNEVLDAPDKDIVDYYALPLMAGQTITVRLINGPFVGIYDQDQRLVASNYLASRIGYSGNNTSGNVNANKTFNERPFQFTAQKPGIYRFAIGTFSGGATDAFGGFQGSTTYNLRITGAGNLGLGALAANSLIYNRTNTGGPLVPPAEPSTMVVNGDLGAVWLGGTDGLLLYSSSEGKPDVEAHGGNLRAVDAPHIGKSSATSGTGATFTIGNNFLANRGNIGVIRARTGNLIVQTARAQQNRGKGAGGNIQLIAAENGFFYGKLYADKALGTLTASDMATTASSWIEVNADTLGTDGVIDLIDVEGQMGTINAGGPAITTHQGGNVRYIRAGGTVYRDRFFGGGAPEQTTFVQGQSANFTDDSGTQITIQPGGDTFADPTGATSNAGTLTVITYPLRSGGVVIMNVQSSRGVNIGSNGIRGGTVEIGRIESFASGASLVNDPGPDFVSGNTDDPLGPDDIANSGDEPLILDPNSTTPENSIRITGNTRTDVLEIKGNSFNEIRNTTGGEIVSTNITGTVGVLESGTLGIARNSTGMPPRFVRVSDVSNGNLGLADGVATNFPFRDQRNGIVVVGNVAEMRSTLGMGNIMVDGRVSRIAANADGRFVSGVMEGITAPIFVTGNITTTIIGEGIMPSGSGGMSNAGLYSLGRIGTVTNQGLGSDIRGDVVSAQNIDLISLRDGAIIGAAVGVISATGTTGVSTDPNNPDLPTGNNNGSDLEGVRRFGQPIAIAAGLNINGRPVGEITRMGLTGRGGIIGSTFHISNLGAVDVRNGFGILSSFFNMTGAGRLNQISTDGYGIRNSIFQGGAYGVGFNARATGKQIPTTTYTPSVRLSETYKFDPYTGQPVDFFTDLHAALGTSRRKPVRTASTYGGAIQNSTFVSSRDLGAMTADRIADVTVSYGNEIRAISSRKTITAMTVTGGSVGSLKTGGNIDRSVFTIAGPMSNIHIGGAYRGSNRILAQGPNGSIGDMIVDGSLYGAIQTTTAISSVRVGGDVGSESFVTGGNFKQLIIGGNVVDGSDITIQKTLQQLIVGGDVQSGAKIDARDIVRKLIKGKQLGTVNG
ncbi:MAG TPA: hypothetical protein VF669_22640 [Tepidisphaeraceae bacterium]